MKVFKHQIWHLIFLVVSLAAISQLVRYNTVILEGSFLSVSTDKWFIVAILAPIIHQIYVLICWRMELYYNSLTSRFGENAFSLYKVGFFILFSGRFLSIILLSISNAQSFEMNLVFRYGLILLLLVPAVYAFYSVKTYFGFDKAAGLDHFDSRVSTEPFVKGGIFKYTNNGMYKFAFLIFYVPGLICLSDISLIVSLFSHLYIWVHYYFTELPDIKDIYQNN